MTNKKTISSVSELLKVIELPNALRIYRGQGKRRTWPLLPSIARLPNDILDDFDDWTFLQETFLTHFKRLSLPYLDKEPNTDIEWLHLARNHGLPTNILDWTTNPLKALFFAVEDPRLDNCNGVLWSLEIQGYYSDQKYVKLVFDQSDQQFIDIYVPSHDNPRLHAQETIYVLFRFPKSYKPFKPLDTPNAYSNDISNIEKFTIPKESKDLLRKELSNLGISHMSLFPGLDSVTKTILMSFNLFL